jgi:predicted Rossmann-fold nucleotide-binding protein
VEELMEIVTWKQLGLYLNPIVVLNVNGFYDPLLEQLERCIDGHFMRPEHAHIWKVAASAEEAVEQLYAMPKWDRNVRKYAAI